MSNTQKNTREVLACLIEIREACTMATSMDDVNLNEVIEDIDRLTVIHQRAGRWKAGWNTPRDRNQRSSAGDHRQVTTKSHMQRQTRKGFQQWSPFSRFWGEEDKPWTPYNR